MRMGLFNNESKEEKAAKKQAKIDQKIWNCFVNLV